MDKLNNVLETMDFAFLSTGQHAMSIDAMKKAINDDNFLFLDVRCEDETKYLPLPFMKHIPMHELTERIDELPKDKCIVTFCSAIFRASVVYTFLRANGFSQVKCLTATMEDVTLLLRPGFVATLS